MSQFDISSAVGTGLGLIRRRPLAVAAWGVLMVGFIGIALAVMLPAFRSLFWQVGQPGGVQPDPSTTLAAIAQIQAASLLLQVGVIVVQTVVTAAVYRAVLYPEQDAWAYLRLGVAELYLGLLTFGARLALGFGIVFAAMPFALAAIALVASHAIAAGVIVGVIGGLGVASVAIWLSLRFSLAGPMIVADNEFRLIESWRLTKGHAGGLLMMTLWLVVILVALELVVYGVCVGMVLANLSAAPGGLAGLRRLNAQSVGPLLNALMPSLVVVGVIGTLFVGVILTIFTAPWAAVYRQLAPAEPTAA